MSNCSIEFVLKTPNYCGTRFGKCKAVKLHKFALFLWNLCSKCRQPVRNLFPNGAIYDIIHATNWSSNCGLAAKATLTCRTIKYLCFLRLRVCFLHPPGFDCSFKSLLGRKFADLLLWKEAFRLYRFFFVLCSGSGAQ